MDHGAYRMPPFADERCQIGLESDWNRVHNVTDLEINRLFNDPVFAVWELPA